MFLEEPQPEEGGNFMQAWNVWHDNLKAFVDFMKAWDSELTRRGVGLGSFGQSSRACDMISSDDIIEIYRQHLSSVNARAYPARK